MKSQIVVLSLTGALAALGACLAALALVSPGAERRPAESFAYGPARAALQVLWQAPSFTFRDQEQRVVEASSLAGHVWIASFFFATCTSVCPVLSSKLVLLQQQLPAPALRFVSFSVDPAHDTPEVLREYAAQWAADPRWHLLSTDPEGLNAVARGMRVAVEPSGDPSNAILHTSMFFLVDAAGGVRGIYDSSDEAALQRLASDAARLLATTPRFMVEGSGEQLYRSLSCAACHDNPKLAPALAGISERPVVLSSGQTVSADTAYLRESIASPGVKVVSGYLNIMPSYASVLHDEQLDGLVEYLRGAGVVAASVPAPASMPAPTAARRKKAVPHPPPQAATPPKPATAASVTAASVTPAPATAALIVEDPICHMSVRVTADTPHVVRDGRDHYFCSEACRQRFERKAR